jgi:hypothetical protein
MKQFIKSQFSLDKNSPTRILINTAHVTNITSNWDEMSIFFEAGIESIDYIWTYDNVADMAQELERLDKLLVM